MKRVVEADLMYFFVTGIPAARFQEKEAALAATVRWLLEISREIERRVIRFPFILHD